MADLRKKRSKTHPRTPPLSEAERTFCAEYLKTDDKAVAIKAAWPAMKNATADELKRKAHNVTRNVRVKREMERLREAASAEVGFSVAEALEAYLTIWRADPNDLVSLRVGNCRYCNGEHFAYQWTEREYEQEVRETLRNRAASKAANAHELFPDADTTGGFGYEAFQPPHPDCPECGGEGIPRVVACDTTDLTPGGQALFAGVEHSKYGPKILMHNRMEALTHAARIVGAFEDRIRIKTETTSNAFNVNFDTNDPMLAAAAYKQLMSAPEG